MSIDVDYDEQSKCILIKIHNTVGCDEICALRDQLLNHPKFTTNINQIFDATEGQLQLTMEDLQKIASHYSEEVETLGNKRKLALVVSKDLDFARTRQYEAFFDSGPNVLIHSDLFAPQESVISLEILFFCVGSFAICWFKSCLHSVRFINLCFCW